MKVTHTLRRHCSYHGDAVETPISLAKIPGTEITEDRAETTPTRPTIRTHTPKRLRGAALAASDARKVDELAARICSYRSAMMPAVTVAMEGGEG